MSGKFETPVASIVLFVVTVAVVALIAAGVVSVVTSLRQPTHSPVSVKEYYEAHGLPCLYATKAQIGDDAVLHLSKATSFSKDEPLQRLDGMELIYSEPKVAEILRLLVRMREATPIVNGSNSSQPIFNPGAGIFSLPTKSPFTLVTTSKEGLIVDEQIIDVSKIDLLYDN